MLVWPISSPKMTRILGLRPGAGAGTAAEGAAFWACASAPEVSVAAATSVDVPSRIFRRLMDLPPVLSDRNSTRTSSLSLPLICLSIFCRKLKSSRSDVPPHAAESEVAGGCIDRLGMTRRRPVATAVVWRAQMGAALDHLAWNTDAGLTGIMAIFFVAAARIFRNTARLRRIGFVSGGVPVRRPFPDIADHVVDAVTIRRKRRHWRGALKAIRVQILPRELTLPGVSQVRAAGREFIAPGEFGTVEAAASGEFPLCFGRQILTGPFCVSKRIGKGHVHDGMVVMHIDVALRPIRMAPIGAFHELPPLAPVAQVGHALLRREHQRALVDHMRQRAWVILRIGRNLGKGFVTGRPDERLELPVRDRRAVDPEAVHRYLVDRSLFRVMVVRAHPESAAGNPDHANVPATLRGPIVPLDSRLPQRHDANSGGPYGQTSQKPCVRLGSV